LPLLPPLQKTFWLPLEKNTVGSHKKNPCDAHGLVVRKGCRPLLDILRTKGLFWE